MLRHAVFDLGGSGGKLFLGRFDGSSLRLEAAHRFPVGAVPINGGLYWDIVGIYRQLLEGLDRLALSGPLDSLGIDSFSNDFGLIGRDDSLLAPVRCYRDRRTEIHASFIEERFPRERLYAITGNQHARFNTLMQLGAMRASGNGFLLDNARQLLFVPDLLLYFLTGEAATESTIASVSQLTDCSTGKWSGEILDALGLSPELFGPLVRTGSHTGRLRQELGGGSRGDPRVVRVCEHDTASAFLAAPVTGRGQAILSSGTWSLLGQELPSPLINRGGFEANIANEGGYPGPHHRFLINVMGNWILQELRRELSAGKEKLSFAELEAEAAAAKPFRFFVDVDDPAFFAPGGMAGKLRDACLRRCGAAPEDTGSLVRCVYESMALKYRRNLIRLEEASGIRLESIHVVGGGASDALMCQMTASACGRPVLAGPRDATALGNLVAQLIAAGELASVEEGREAIGRSFPPVEYAPYMAGIWEERYLSVFH